MFVSPRRDAPAARGSLPAIGTTKARPRGRDRPGARRTRVIEELLPAPCTDRAVRQQPGRSRPRPAEGAAAADARAETDHSAGGHLRPCLVQNFGVATTNWRSRRPQSVGCRPRSTSWLWRSEPSASNGFGMPPVDQMQQTPLGRRPGIRVQGAAVRRSCRVPGHPPRRVPGHHPGEPELRGGRAQYRGVSALPWPSSGRPRSPGQDALVYGAAGAIGSAAVQLLSGSGPR